MGNKELRRQELKRAQIFSKRAVKGIRSKRTHDTIGFGLFGKRKTDQTPAEL